MFSRLGYFSPTARFLCSPFFSFRPIPIPIPTSRRISAAKGAIREMSFENSQSSSQKPANFRLCNVSSCTIELLEVEADHPLMHVLVIPGNPGAVTFYSDFVESLFQLLGGRASITVIGHTGHTKKNWERGRLFSLQEQIDHKMDFIQQELHNTGVPLILVGHSIGSYIALQMFRRSPDKVFYYIGLYPFLSLNLQSKKQIAIRKFAKSKVLSTLGSLLIASVGLLPSRALRLIAKIGLGKSSSSAAVETLVSHLTQYHNMRNVLFMAMTEFRVLAEIPDWAFMKKREDKIAFLFGIDDHWGPLQMFEEISRQAPGTSLSIEREGHTHSFCCTEAGSLWVARHVASLINKDRIE